MKCSNCDAHITGEFLTYAREAHAERRDLNADLKDAGQRPVTSVVYVECADCYHAGCAAECRSLEAAESGAATEALNDYRAERLYGGV